MAEDVEYSGSTHGNSTCLPFLSGANSLLRLAFSAASSLSGRNGALGDLVACPGTARMVIRILSGMSWVSVSDRTSAYTHLQNSKFPQNGRAEADSLLIPRESAADDCTSS